MHILAETFISNTQPGFLKDFRIYGEGTDRMMPITSAVLQQLLKFVELRVLMIHLPCTFDDGIIHSLSKSLPHLEEFSTGQDFEEHKSLVTFQGIIDLVDNCPLLHTLEISLGMKPLAPLPVWNGVGNTKVTEINFRYSFIPDDLKRTAELLHALFPRLRDVAYSWGALDGMGMSDDEDDDEDDGKSEEDEFDEGNYSGGSNVRKWSSLRKMVKKTNKSRETGLIV